MDAERALARLAGAQHGVVARTQLLELGFTRRSIERRIQASRLQLLHRGVYAVGHDNLPAKGHLLAAVLACGPGAVLSHRSAAALWEIRPTARSGVEITTPRWLPQRPRIQLRSARLAPDEVTSHASIPVTAPERTLIDLAAVLQKRPLERALEQAEVLRLLDAALLARLLDRHPRRAGTGTLRALLAEQRASPTRSELEERFLALIDRERLPRPLINAHVLTFEVDTAWPDQRVIAELDGHAFHSTRAAYERDRARDRALQAAGWRVIRVTWRQLEHDSAAVARDLRSMLRRRAW